MYPFATNDTFDSMMVDGYCSGTDITLGTNFTLKWFIYIVLVMNILFHRDIIACCVYPFVTFITC